MLARSASSAEMPARSGASLPHDDLGEPPFRVPPPYTRRMPRTLRVWLVRLSILPACALALAACSSSPSTSSSSTTSTTKASTTTSSSAGGASSTSTTPSTSETSGTLVPQTSTGTEFYSPSKNISCEIDDNFGPSAITSTLCLTISPPKSVTLKTDSSLTECSGVNG